MRIHTLRLSGVGPFRDEFTIDFDAIGNQRLFLIDGDTGTGKSTIIDAIVFALYGRTADNRGGDRMVSDFLPANFAKADRPFVEMVFTVDSGVFRVRREPKYEYVNRNDRSATQNPTVRLERLPNESATAGELLSTSIQEVGAEILRLVQLNADQFLATIVLAQGQFQTFLRAGPDERREILEKVFGTEAYRDVEQRLKERKSEATRRRNEAAGTCQDAAARFHAVSGMTADPMSWRELASRDPEDVVRQAAAHAVIVRDEADAATAIHGEAQREAAAATAAWQAAQQRARLIDEKRDLLSEQESLEQRRGQVEEATQTLAGHERARAVMPSRDRRASARRRVSAASEAAARSEQGLAEDERASLAGLPPDVLPDAIGEALAELAKQEGALRPVVVMEQGLPALAANVSDARAAEGRYAADLAGVRADFEALPQQLADLQERREGLRVRADAVPDRVQAVERARVGLNAATAAADRQRELAVADERRGAANEALADATAHAHRVEAAYHANLAGVLAEQLVAGDPCPVCGGTEHPAPTPPAQDDANRDSVAKARAAVDTRRSAVEQANEAVSRLTADLAAELARAQHHGLDQWQQEVRDAEAALGVAKTAGREVAELTSQIAELEQRRTELEQKAAALVREEASAQADATAAAAKLAEHEQVVVAARMSHESVARRVATLSGRAKALRTWQSDQGELHEARALAAAAEEAFDLALTEHGFATEDEVMAALLMAPTEAELRRAIAEFTADESRVSGRLTAPDLAAVDASEVVDLATPEQAARMADEKLAEAAAVATTAATRARNSDQNLETLRRAASALTTVKAQVAPLIRISDIVNGLGENTLGVPLSHYVVLKRFEEVLEAANIRLQSISDGRYLLQPDITARQGREARRGLGLRILDERTGQARDVSTLSGGETFYTSLSLALGLADVVQQEAGGVHMKTLFVDEGFGSLDAETLEAVMSVLGTLSKGDRMVGVISHVTEMKQSIPYRVHVQRPDRDGPSTIITPE